MLIRQRNYGVSFNLISAGVPLVLQALLAGGGLQTLDLGANGLTGAGFEALLPGLAACSSLKTLEVKVWCVALVSSWSIRPWRRRSRRSCAR